MPKTKHTSGKWRQVVHLSQANDYCIHVPGVDGKKICTMPSEQECLTTPELEERKANAQLISAAPDMLYALRFADKYYYLSNGKHNPLFTKAIAKAEGK